MNLQRLKEWIRKYNAIQQDVFKRKKVGEAPTICIMR